MPPRSGDSTGSVVRNSLLVECWLPRKTAGVKARILVCGHVVAPAAAASYGVRTPCPVCGKTAATEDLRLCIRDYVPKASLTWDAEVLKDKKFVEQGHEAERYRFESFVHRLSSTARYLDLGTHVLRPQRATRKPDSFLVWRAEPAGCTVRRGTITLPTDGILLLAGHGAHFKNTTFTGGMLMCAGQHFAGTFDSCVFAGCTLYAVHGARVTLRSSRFLRCIPAVVASCGATLAHFNKSVFFACQTGIIVDSGASVELNRSPFMNCPSAIVVNDPGSHAAVETTDMHISEDVAHAMCAVMVGAGAGACMRNCNISGFWLGLHAYGRATVAEIHTSRIVYFPRGLLVEDSARVAVHDVCMASRQVPPHKRMLYAGEADDGAPVAVTCHVRPDNGHRDAFVQLHRGSVEASAGQAVHALNGGRVDVLLSEVTCPVLAVKVAYGISRAWLRFCAVRTEEHSCHVFTSKVVLWIDSCHFDAVGGTCVICQGTLVVRDSDFCGGSPSDICALFELDKCSMSLVRSKVHGGVMGLRADDSTVRICDTDILCMPRLGGFARERRRKQQPPGKLPVAPGVAAVFARTTGLDMRRGSVQGHANGVVVQAEGSVREYHARIDGVCFDGGAQCVHFGEMVEGVVSRCRFVGCDVERARRITDSTKTMVMMTYEDSNGVNCCPGGVTVHGRRGSVQDCTFDGPWLAVDGRYHTAMHVRGCTFVCPPQRDRPFVCIGAGAVVEDCQFSGANTGIIVHGGSAAEVTVVRSCTFGAECDTGVAVEEGGRAQVLDCAFRGCRVGMNVASGCELAAQDVHCTRTGIGVCVEGVGTVMSAKRLTVVGKAESAGLLTQCKTGKKSEVRLVDSSITGGETGALLGDADVDVSILRCQIEGAGVGVFAFGSVNLRLRKSNVRMCRCGVSVGDQRRNMIDACAECGRSGYPGYLHALATVHAAQGRRLVGAQCPHEGTVARAVLEDVRVEGCSTRGVQASALGQISAQRVHVDGGGIHILRVSEHLCSRFEDCSVSEADDVACNRVAVENGHIVETEEVTGLQVVPVAESRHAFGWSQSSV